MNRRHSEPLFLCTSLLTLLALAPAARAQWTAPTEEELKMTSQPQVPGAPAVYLYREEITDDKLHMWSIYVRLKVLTERGKEYANVTVEQYSTREYEGAIESFTVGGIAARTIHPDGTIIPFTGKTYDKLVEKDRNVKVTRKVFTLPDVEIGSIIEYRYQLSYGDGYFIPPNWYVQSDLYTRKAYYLWRPTNETLITTDGTGTHATHGIAWTPILPKDADFKQTHLPDTAWETGRLSMELRMHDIPPTPDEELMPPITSLGYRVLFYYTSFQSGEEFWRTEGKIWSRDRDRFIGPGPKIKDAVKGLVADSDTPDQKLRKLYAAVMQLDNTSYTREHSTTEDKAKGLADAKTTDDTWDRKRGSANQLAELFVALARAAGMKAYSMGVTSRDRNIFLPIYYSFSQLDDEITIVNVDGKEQFFDPGQRYCPYRQLAWKHTNVRGVRQTDGGTSIVETPGQAYTDSRTDRVADLIVDDKGQATGAVTMIFRGAPALRWRQAFLRGDDASLKRDLREAVEKLMPAGMDVSVKSVQNLEDYEQPLTVMFDVKGQIGSSTGKRLLFPCDIFEVQARPQFPHEKREVAVSFDYSHSVVDAMRIRFPRSLSLESVPVEEKDQLQGYAFYALTSETAASSVTVRRSFGLGELMYPPAEYPALRAFYGKLENKDHELIVFAAAPPPAGN